MIVGELGMLLIVGFFLTIMTPVVTVIGINEVIFFVKLKRPKMAFINTLLLLVIGIITILLIKHYRPFEWLYLYIGIVGLADAYLFIKRKKQL